MRALDNPFCAVCQRVIRKKLAPFLPQTRERSSAVLLAVDALLLRH
jgi:hypothetical protein